MHTASKSSARRASCHVCPVQPPQKESALRAELELVRSKLEEASSKVQVAEQARAEAVRALAENQLSLEEAAKQKRVAELVSTVAAAAAVAFILMGSVFLVKMGSV